MARKSAAEDIIDVTSKLPWWVGMLLAVISYAGLHTLAATSMPSSSGGLSSAMKSGLIHTLANLGQYVLPALFSIGAVFSLFMSIKRKKLHNDVTKGHREIADVSWQDFELLIGEHFRREGFSAKETSRGADGGVDLILKKNGATYIVQCKHYKAYKVGVKPVRELLGVMASCGAAGGFVVTSGEFTGDAIDFAKTNNIKLIDGKDLSKILKTTPRPAQRHTPEQPSQKMQSPATTDFIKPSIAGDEPKICPKCGSPMAIRVARKGSHAGQKFFGCTGYPKCKFTQPFE